MNKKDQRIGVNVIGALLGEASATIVDELTEEGTLRKKAVLTVTEVASTFKVGDRVWIFNRSVEGTYVKEGMATIVESTSLPDRYRVKFTSSGDSRVYERFVDPAAQKNPDAYLKRLNEIIEERK